MIAGIQLKCTDENCQILILNLMDEEHDGECRESYFG